MDTIKIDGFLLQKMIISGANALNQCRYDIDAMNVFPVPDGDTGTNMAMTMIAAAREVNKLKTANISEVAKAAASGSLRGARGNSGVILSQLFRGFSKGLTGITTAEIKDLANACEQAAETAYKAVMKPKEGTILTVAKAIGDQAAVNSTLETDFISFFKQTLDYANETLEKTPQMLSELRQAGVVDAGGKGLLVVLEGAFKSINALIEPLLDIGLGKEPTEINKSSIDAPHLTTNIPAAITTTDIKFGYCTEFFINAKNISDLTENNFKHYLETIGDSIVVVSDDELMKIHVHTNHPGTVLEKALSIGSLSNLKIENMRMQHTSLIKFANESKLYSENNFSNENKLSKESYKEMAFAAVCAGKGFKELFINLGVDEIIEGGQTMNPSIEDILYAIEKINANTVFVLPNNKNIILTAEQAAKLCKNKNVIVIPTKTIPQGLTSVISLVSTYSVTENESLMKNAMQKIKTGFVTKAVRATIIDGKNITPGDFLFIIDEKIKFVGNDLQEGSKKLIDLMMTPGLEVIGIYYGEETKMEHAEEIAIFAREKYSNFDVEIFYGGQPIYNYIFSAE